MDKQQADKQADDLIGMDFNVPHDLTAPMQMKLANELARQLEKGNKVGKTFWFGAAAVVLINVIGITLHFSDARPSRMTQTDGEISEGEVQISTGIQDVANYYYSDKLNSY